MTVGGRAVQRAATKVFCDRTAHPKATMVAENTPTDPARLKAIAVKVAMMNEGFRMCRCYPQFPINGPLLIKWSEQSNQSVLLYVRTR